jgi:hypothetical protein
MVDCRCLEVEVLFCWVIELRQSREHVAVNLAGYIHDVSPSSVPTVGGVVGRAQTQTMNAGAAGQTLE